MPHQVRKAKCRKVMSHEPQPDKQGDLALHHADVVDLGMGSTGAVNSRVNALRLLVRLPFEEDGVGVGRDPVTAFLGQEWGLQHGQAPGCARPR